VAELKASKEKAPVKAARSAEPMPFGVPAGNELFGSLSVLPQSHINLLEPSTLAMTCRAGDRLSLRGKSFQTMSERQLERKVKQKHLEVLKLREDMAGIWKFRWEKLQAAEEKNSSLRAEITLMKREQGKTGTLGASMSATQLGGHVAPDAPQKRQIASPEVISNLSGLISGFTDQEVQHLAGKELNQLKGAYADFAIAVEGLAGSMNVSDVGLDHAKTQKNLKEASTRAKYKAKAGDPGAWCDLALGVAKQTVGYGETSTPKLPPLKKAGGHGKRR
jgi:hypothetical protein